MRAFEYRLYPTKEQHQQLLACLVASRHIYNAMLQASEEQYAQTGKFLFKYDLCKRFAGRSGDHVPATTVQTLADRPDKALKRYLDRRETDETAGFPRFKTPNRWHSAPTAIISGDGAIGAMHRMDILLDDRGTPITEAEGEGH
jgi:putative transposase